PEISTLSLHDALPICVQVVDVDAVLDSVPADLVGLAEDGSSLHAAAGHPDREAERMMIAPGDGGIAGAVLAQRCAAKFRQPHDQDRKSTRLNSSHVSI